MQRIPLHKRLMEKSLNSESQVSINDEACKHDHNITYGITNVFVDRSHTSSSHLEVLVNQLCLGLKDLCGLMHLHYPLIVLDVLNRGSRTRYGFWYECIRLRVWMA